jgi:uncharacterized coiled-coil protein SlyX
MRDSLEIKVAVLEERLVQANHALELQAKAYEYRLENLNHSAEKMSKMQETYLTKDAYELRLATLETKIDAMMKLTYVGLGVILATEFFLKFFIK